jgi:hypothetical protein
LVISLQNAGPLFGRFDASKNYGTEKAFKIAEHNHKEYVKALKDTYADAKVNNDTFSIDVIKSTCEKYGIVIEENFGVSLPKYSFEKWNFTTQSELIYIADEFLKTIDKSFSVSNGDLWNKAKQNLMRAVLSYMYETDCQQMTAKRASDIFRLKSESLSEGTDNTKFDKLFEDLHKTNENSFAYKEYTSCMLLPKKTIEAIIISICLDLTNYIALEN